MKGTQYTNMFSECKYLVRTQWVELATLKKKNNNNTFQTDLLYFSILFTESKVFIYSIEMYFYFKHKLK